MRRGSLRLIQNTLDSHASRALLNATPAEYGSAEEVERSILMREVQDKLSADGVKSLEEARAPFLGVHCDSVVESLE